ncbi:energy-coupling factor transporter transmembrane component T [Nocardioides caeni]|uniref:Energy-coupling factor transporter transmembrane protein EcfT n=1 Tax=Nocardioides caeni TaxID=574700 RepID=A0A4S8NLF6_9ACTN|nr:energy-coupling factor transporter transmembrane component T [Nocardioides caeni]THV17823.1 energy-coupling factor transporter transmembrane protein EcfT [Nocardioides caeni]
MAGRIPRDLHPVAWWVWAIGLAVGATCTTNPFLLAILLAVVTLTVLSCRGDQPWARSFRLYVWIGALVIVTRILFRIVLGGDVPGQVILRLPDIPLPDVAAGISLLGPFTREELLASSYDGLRLAALLIAVGAANALANPKRLMKSLPPALYEVGTAMTVAISVVPQLADSARRVRAAQELRGAAAGRFRRIRGVRRLLVPILEDAFDRSLALAAGMDARGYGRTGESTPAQRRTTGALMLVGLSGVCVGVYAVLDATAPRVLAVPLVVAGTAVALVGMASAGRRVGRTRYRADRWRLPELLVALSGVVAGAGLWAVQRWQVDVAHPGVLEVPEIGLGAVAVILVGVLPVWVAPPPLTASTQPTATAALRAPAEAVAAR